MSIVSHSNITVSGIDVSIDRKDIKNLHVGVYPPYGRVRVATPSHIDDEAVRLAVISRLSWVKKQISQFQEQKRESKREMVSGESHYFFGKRYLLDVVYGSGKHKITLNHSTLELHVREDTNVANRQMVLNEWYRDQLKETLSKIIVKWEQTIGIKLSSWQIKKMRTKWGSCNIEQKKILLNLELAKKPIEYVEYIVVHEMVHLLERHHNNNFKKLMNYYLPQWEKYRDRLNNSILVY